MIKRVLSMILVTMLIVTIVPENTVIKAKSTNANYANQVINTLGIMKTDGEIVDNPQAVVTRAQFAQMLVNMSTFKDMISEGAHVSLFNDVKSTYPAGGYIKVAISNDWMSGYLNGTFKPDQAITLQEAVNAIVKLLGYVDTDFTGNKNASKMSLYYSKNLDENISKGKIDKLTRVDCTNLFYNTLITTTKAGTVYGQTLGYTVDTDGHIKYLDLVNKELEGPIIAQTNWKDKIPFSADTAIYYRNGFVSEISSIQINDVLYYSETLDTIWSYSDKVTGTLKAVAPSEMAPTEITLAGSTYTLGSQEMSYQFSTIGEIAVGDVITILLGKDNKVAGVLAKEEINDTVNGVVIDTGEKVSTDKNDKIYASAYVTLLDSNGHKIEVEYKGGIDDYDEGQVIEATYAKGEATIKVPLLQYETPIHGKVSADGNAIAGVSIAKDASILEVKDESFMNVPKSRIANVELYLSDILYYARNSKGEIDELILDDVTGDLDSYGILLDYNANASTALQIMNTYEYLIDGKEGTITTEKSMDVSKPGPCSFYIKEDKVEEIKNLYTTLVSSIEGNIMISYKQPYILADEVAVYYQKEVDNKKTYHKTTLSSVNDMEKFNLVAYYDQREQFGGRVRVIVAQDK